MRRDEGRGTRDEGRGMREGWLTESRTDGGWPLSELLFLRCPGVARRHPSSLVLVP
jgi:hypothetical protein